MSQNSDSGKSQDELLSGFAHELNQPVTAILNYLLALRRTLNKEDEDVISKARDLTDRAIQQVERAGSIIRGLRDLAAGRKSDRTLESLSELVERVALAEANSASSVVFILKLERALPRVLVARVQIEQVLINLIRNSVEAMRSVKPQTLTISTTAEDGFVSIAVRDSGPGVPDEMQAKLFEPFVTSKKDGLGLGLSICRAIVSSHDGTIDLVSNGKRGAEIKVRLPREQ